MTTFPRKDRRARTGSNLRGNPLLSHRSQLLSEQQRSFQRLARDFQREGKKLFSKADLRAAGGLAGEVYREWRQASLTAGGDSARGHAIKARARRKLDRLLTSALPNYRKFQALQHEYSREHGKLVEALLAGPSTDQVHVAWGDLAVSDDIDTQEFTGSFPIYDVETIDESRLIVEDESFVLPASGGLVNRITFDHETNEGWGLAAIFGTIPIGIASSLVSCGVAHTMPRPGRLRISAVLRNLYNQIMCSLEDRFGFSGGNLTVQLRLFIDILRTDMIIHLPTTLYSEGLVSHGIASADLSGRMPSLDNSAPYTLNVVTDEAFPAGHGMWIVAGSEVHIISDINDMRSHVNAIIWWQLKKLIVGIVD